MIKNAYEKLEMEIVVFDSCNVITSSGDDEGEVGL